MGAYSTDIREKIVKAYEAGNTSIRKVAERFMVTKRTVHRLVKQYRETGNLEPKKPGGKAPSCLEAHKELIVSTVEEHPDWTLWQYCEEIGEKTGVYVSTVTMCLFLKRQNLTLKKKTFRSERIANAEGQQERLDYWQAVKDVKPENLIFIDETGIWEGMERPKARSIQGRRAFRMLQRSKTHSNWCYFDQRVGMR